MSGVSTDDNDQFGLVSPDATRAGAGLASAVAGEAVKPLEDEEGRLWVRPVGIAPPFPPFVTRWQDQRMGDFIESAQTLAVPGALQQISGYVQGDADTIYYLQIYDLAAGPPTEEEPIEEIPGIELFTFGWAPGDGWTFVNGIFVGVSTTPGFFTGADEIMKYSATGWL